MTTQHDHDEGDCPLCGGTGEVSISKDGTYEGTDYYGCPMCISRERDEEARLIETQRDELLAVNAGLAQAARHLLEAVEDFEGYRQDIATAIADLRDALDAAPQPAAVEQGPVGFMNAGHLCELENRRIPYVYVYPNQGAGAEVPLYTAPQPARQPARQPLTDEQIDNMVVTASLAERDLFRRFARAVERAHGIGGEA